MTGSRLGLGVVLVLARVSGAQEPSPAPAPPKSETRFEAEPRRRAPRPADVWSLLRDVPGILLDRVDVGGSETAVQSLVVSKGDPGPGTSFEIDGFDVTDPSSLGFLALFPDLDALGDVSVRTSAWDARVRASGAQVRLGLPAATDRLSGGAHLRGSGASLRSDNTPEALRARVFEGTQVERLLEYGLRAGGPVGGRGRFFAAASRQELRQDVFTGHDETLRLDSLLARGSLRRAGGETALLVVRSAKRDDDRDPVLQAAPESRWIQSGDSWLLGASDARAVGPLRLATRLSWLDSGFRLDPRGGASAQAREDTSGVFRGSYLAFETDRDRIDARAEVEARPQLFGRTHWLDAGAGWSRADAATHGAWPGNGVVAYERQDVFFRTFRLTGFAQLTRDQDVRTTVERAFAFVQDRARFGRLELALGLRLDRQVGRAGSGSAPANALRPDLLPGLESAGTAGSIRWNDVLPRAGAAFDLGDGRSRIRVNYSAYGAWLGAGDPGYDDPLREVASLSYLWRDSDANGRVGPSEVLSDRGLQASSGLDPDEPGSAQSPHAIDPALDAPRTDEWLLGFEHGGSRWNARLQATLRRRSVVLWQPLRGLTRADYGAVAVASGTLFGREYAETAWAPLTLSAIVPGNGRQLANRDGYHEDFAGLEAELGGPLGRDGRFRVWGAWQEWQQRFVEAERAVQDPTPTDSDPLRDRGPLAVRPGGLGRGDVFVSARFAGGADAEAALPAGLRGGLRLYVRDGFPVPYHEVVLTGDATGSAKPVLVAARLDAFRLPTLVQLDLRLERSFGLGPGTLRLGVDVFNALDRATTLQAARDVELPVPGRPREILRPRMLRLGADFRF